MSKPTDAWQVAAPFVYRRRLRFGEADPARIAYTPRLFDLSMEALEVWFREVGGFDWYDININHRRGTPFVRVEMDMRAPVTPERPLALEVRVVETGRSSIRFSVIGRREDDRVICFEGLWTCAVVDTDKAGAIPIPEPLASRIADYRAACDAADAWLPAGV